MDFIAEFRESGLALERLGGNSGKLRLSLDLAALASTSRRLRVLDVGCAGPTPLNLWEPFLPLRDRLDVVGVDVDGLSRTRARARELDFPIALREGSALTLTRQFAVGSFDAVVCTQVLEHLRAWPTALAEMSTVVREGGTLFVTCDSAHVARPLSSRIRLAGKRSYALVREAVRPIRRLGDRFVSGEWERGLTMPELRSAAGALGLHVEHLSPYGLRDVKRAQRGAGTRTRQLWLALEEALAVESTGPVDPRLYTVLYLRARRP